MYVLKHAHWTEKDPVGNDTITEKIPSLISAKLEWLYDDVGGVQRNDPLGSPRGRNVFDSAGGGTWFRTQHTNSVSPAAQTSKLPAGRAGESHPIHGMPRVYLTLPHENLLLYTHAGQ